MHTALVGYTGFVGGNLAASHPFTALYNSRNITEAFGTRPDLLIYAGVPAAKYLANRDPEADWQAVHGAFENIRAIAPRQLVLISTVDVYADPQGVDENTPADTDAPGAYGRNRARLEALVRQAVPNCTVVRLPALLGNGLKKNFLHDILHPAPTMLMPDRMRQLESEPLVARCYQPVDRGFVQVCTSAAERAELDAWFAKQPFNALSFTDSSARYQFYDLSLLWRDLTVALAHRLPVLNLTAEPLCAADIYAALTHGGVFENHISSNPVSYDMRSIHAGLFGGENGYCLSAADSMNAIRSFMAAAHREGTR